MIFGSQGGQAVSFPVMPGQNMRLVEIQKKTDLGFSKCTISFTGRGVQQFSQLLHECRSVRNEHFPKGL
jgi:hypothetical protein